MVAPQAKDATLEIILTLPVIEERLHVDKRIVAQGGYRLTKQVSSREVTVDELLRNEKVLIERRPIGQILQGLEPPKQRYEGDVPIIPVVEEIAVVQKQLVLVEEIRITRVSSTHRSPRRVTLRSEEIFVAPLDGQIKPPVQGL